MSAHPASGEAERVLAGRTAAQARLLCAMRVNRPKKWRAVYRDAKVSFHRGADHQLPFSLAHPTLTGFEVLTPLGLAVRSLLQERNQ